MILRAVAPAKINLFLHVTGVRNDGYHELESVVTFVDGVGDVLTVAPADELSLSVTGEFADTCGAVDDNIVLKVARHLQSTLKVPHGTAITLEKNIPAGAGLGGGSADAAAVARLLMQLWDRYLSDAELKDELLPFGADIPMCFDKKTMFISGIGEKLKVMPKLRECGITLCYPGKPLATPAVFQAYDTSGAEDTPALVGTIPDERIQWLRTQHNDLQHPAIGLLPKIQDCLQEMEQIHAPLLVRMTGSGSTCFALYETQEEAVKSAKSLSENHPGYWVKYGTVKL